MRHVSKHLAALVLSFIATPLVAQGDSILRDRKAVYTEAVALLPIEFPSTDPKAATLAAETYEAMLNRVSSIEGVYALERGLVLPYTDSPAEEIGRQLGVSTVLESRIVAEPPIYRLRFRHIDAQSGSLLASGESVGGRRGVPALAQRVVEWLFPDPASDREQAIAAAQATVLDDTRSFEERLAALSKLSPPRILSGQQHLSGYVENGRISGSVAVAAAQLAIDADNPSIRMNAWHRLAGVADPLLVEPLLYAMSSDNDARVRAQAARTLVGFLDQPEVRDALSLARSDDPAEDVREAAHFSLLSSKEQQEELRAGVLNTSLAAEERAMALGKLRFDYDYSEAIDRSVVVAMATVAKRSDDAGLRSFVWSLLSGTGDPYLVEPLLTELAGHPVETVREVVVQGLAEFIDYPGVREALETAAVEDPSRFVREGARDSLDLANR